MRLITDETLHCIEISDTLQAPGKELFIDLSAHHDLEGRYQISHFQPLLTDHQ